MATTDAPATRSYAEMAADLDETSGTFWDPAEGDSLGGLLTKIERNVGTKGDSTIYSVRGDDDQVTSFWGSAVLDRELSQARVGDVVLIKYFGKKVSAKGTSYKSYSVRILPRSVMADSTPF